MFALIAHVPGWAWVVVYVLYMAVVANLPKPDAASSKWYRFWYGFLHTIAVNVESLRALNKPPVPAPPAAQDAPDGAPGTQA